MIVIVVLSVNTRNVDYRALEARLPVFGDFLYGAVANGSMCRWVGSEYSSVASITKLNNFMLICGKVMCSCLIRVHSC